MSRIRSFVRFFVAAFPVHVPFWRRPAALEPPMQRDDDVDDVGSSGVLHFYCRKKIDGNIPDDGWHDGCSGGKIVSRKKKSYRMHTLAGAGLTLMRPDPVSEEFDCDSQHSV